MKHTALAILIAALVPLQILAAQAPPPEAHRPWIELGLGVSKQAANCASCYQKEMGGPSASLSFGGTITPRFGFAVLLRKFADQAAIAGHRGVEIESPRDFGRALGPLRVPGAGGATDRCRELIGVAGELVGRFNYDRAPAAAIALTTDTSALTAIANDYGYERVFERQVRALGHKGDVLIAISTSGRSPNILRAIAAAREIGMIAVGFTGKSGGEMAALCDLCLFAPCESTPLIQQIHMTAGHVIFGLVEERLFPRVAIAQQQATTAG